MRALKIVLTTYCLVMSSFASSEDSVSLNNNNPTTAEGIAECCICNPHLCGSGEALTKKELELRTQAELLAKRLKKLIEQYKVVLNEKAKIQNPGDLVKSLDDDISQEIYDIYSALQKYLLAPEIFAIFKELDKDTLAKKVARDYCMLFEGYDMNDPTTKMSVDKIYSLFAKKPDIVKQIEAYRSLDKKQSILSSKMQDCCSGMRQVQIAITKLDNKP